MRPLETTARKWLQVCCASDAEGGADADVTGLSSELSRSRGQDCEVPALMYQATRTRSPDLVTRVKRCRQLACSSLLQRNWQLKFAPLRQHLYISTVEAHPWGQKGFRTCKACPDFIVLKVLQLFKQGQKVER